ncbi:hypothetical protein BC829DRAFT_383878 [Chytridium lagenaria]|nr:hypothetical protein BC829DRAFT_383878 [Chytridium lagenaria]
MLEVLDLSSTKITNDGLRRLSRPLLHCQLCPQSGLPNAGLARLSYLNISYCTGLDFSEGPSDTMVGTTLGDIINRFPSLISVDVSGNFGTKPNLKTRSTLTSRDSLDAIKLFSMQMPNWTRLQQDIDLLGAAHTGSTKQIEKPVDAEPSGNGLEPQFLDETRRMFQEKDAECLSTLTESIQETVKVTRRMNNLIEPTDTKSRFRPKNDLILFLCDDAPLYHIRESPPMDWQLRRLLLNKHKSTMASRVLREYVKPLNNSDPTPITSTEVSLRILNDISRSRLAQFVRPRSIVDEQLKARRDRANWNRIHEPRLRDLSNRERMSVVRTEALTQTAKKRMETKPSLVPLKKARVLEEKVGLWFEEEKKETVVSVKPFERPSEKKHTYSNFRKRLQSMKDKR